MFHTKQRHNGRPKYHRPNPFRLSVVLCHLIEKGKRLPSRPAKNISRALCASLKSINSQGGKMWQVHRPSAEKKNSCIPLSPCRSRHACQMRPVEWDLVPARECNQNRLPSTRTSEKLQFQTKRWQMKLNAACSSSSLSESGKSSEHTKPVPVHAPCFCRVGKCVFSQNMFVGNWMTAMELHSSTRSKCAFTKRTTT